MSCISRAARLPEPIRSELDQRLRTAAYGDLRAISAWLQDRSVTISKSALSRYAQRLRAADASRSIGPAAALEVKPRPRSSGRQDQAAICRRIIIRLQEVEADMLLLEALAPRDR